MTMQDLEKRPMHQLRRPKRILADLAAKAVAETNEDDVLAVVVLVNACVQNLIKRLSAFAA
jgi:hypothetical protein